MDSKKKFLYLLNIGITLHAPYLSSVCYGRIAQVILPEPVETFELFTDVELSQIVGDFIHILRGNNKNIEEDLENFWNKRIEYIKKEKG